MREQFKDIIKQIQYYTGYTSLYEFIHAPAENRLLIIMLHDVVSDDDKRSHWYNSDIPSTTELDALLTVLTNRYRLISVEDAVREILSNGAVKTKSVAITFDDGYKSTYEILFPLLKKHNATATIFLPTDWIDGKLDPWWITLTQIIDQGELTVNKLKEAEGVLSTAMPSVEVLLNTPDQAKIVLHEHTGGVLMRKDDQSRVQLLEDLRGVLLEGQSFVPDKPTSITWSQIKEMADCGVKFGAHTCSHPNLSHIDIDSAEREIVESKRIIEQRVGSEVIGFAYPYGYDVAGYRRLRPILVKHGFRYACTSWWGHVDAKSDLYLLGRTSLPQSHSPAVLARNLCREYCMKHWPSPLGIDVWPTSAE